MTTTSEKSEINDSKVNEILEYMPDSFKKAHEEGKPAEYDLDFWEGNEIPTQSDDSWYKTTYFEGYRTENKKLYLIIRSNDQDGNTEYETEVEVGTKEEEEIRKEYLECSEEEWTEYYRWVSENGKDPLHVFWIDDEIINDVFVVKFIETSGGISVKSFRKGKGWRSPKMMPTNLSDYVKDASMIKNFEELAKIENKDVKLIEVKSSHAIAEITIKSTVKNPNYIRILKKKAKESLKRRD